VVRRDDRRGERGSPGEEDRSGESPSMPDIDEAVKAVADLMISPQVVKIPPGFAVNLGNIFRCLADYRQLRSAPGEISPSLLDRVARGRQARDALEASGISFYAVTARPDGIVCVELARGATWDLDRLAELAGILGTTRLSFRWDRGPRDGDERVASDGIDRLWIDISWPPSAGDPTDRAGGE